LKLDEIWQEMASSINQYPNKEFKMKKIYSIIFSVFLVISTVSICIAAENTGERQNASEYQILPLAQRQGQPSERITPLKEALDACTGKNQEDVCEFSAPFGRVTGICRTINNNQLDCMPSGQPPERITPPKEALDACTGKNQEDVCEFSAPFGRVTGICRTINNQLNCMPAGPPRKEQGRQ
jgi:hypothetical protein